MNIYRHLSANNILLQPMPFKRELSMESYLVENQEVLILDNDELSTINILDAELPIKGGRVRKNTDGRIDLLAIYGESTIGVIELKIGELTIEHLRQLEDYLNETKKIEEIVKLKIDSSELKYIGVLVGSTINQQLSDRITQGYLINDSIPVAALTINRYRGQDNNIYIVTDTYFKNVSRKFDKTKYLFNNEEYGKNRLVLAIIKKYVEENYDISYSKLESIFPRSIQGSWGCFDTVSRAQEIYDTSSYKRHFLRPEEIIKLADTDIAVSTQWGLGNIKKFIQKAKSLNYQIEERQQQPDAS